MKYHHLIWHGFEVGVPYLRAKAQDYYEELGGGIESDIGDGTQALTDQVRLPKPPISPTPLTSHTEYNRPRSKSFQKSISMAEHIL